MNQIIDDFLKPESPPDSQFELRSNVIMYREVKEEKVVVEIFQRANGAFGYRYNAWVAWRDASNSIQSHSWYLIDPKIDTVTDDVSTIQQIIENEIEMSGMSFKNNWQSAVHKWT